MSEVKHTAGPWVVYSGDTLIVCTGPEDDEGRGDSICDCAPGNPSVTLAEAEANARLIAASPTLLAAAQSALTFARFELELREPSGDPEYIAYAKRAVESLTNAIAKATGAA